MPKILQILKQRTTPIALVCLILGVILVSNLSKLGAADENLGATVLRAPQGGTGISSATTSDIGKALVVSSTSPFQYKLGTVASSGGGSTTTLTATQVAYGSPDNTVTSSPNFTFTSSTNQLRVTNVSSTSITSTNIYAFGTTTAPCFTNDGVTCITSGGSTSPGGSNTQVQYNNNGAFAGDAGLTFNSTTNRLTVDGVVSSTGLVLNAETLNDFTGTGLQINAGSLELTSAYQDGSAYDSRFVNIDGDTMTGRLSIVGGTPGGLYIYSESEDTPSAEGIYAGYSPDGSGRTKIELSGGTESYIDFTDTGLDFEGRIYYNQATNVLSFYANGSQTMHIDDTSLYATSTNFGLIIMGGDTVNDFTGLNLEVVGNALSVVDDPTFATTTITGGFAQTDFGDCDNGVTSKVLYDSTTLKFSCGTDQTGGSGSVSLTATLIPFGDTDDTLTSSTALSFTTSTGIFSSTRISTTNLQASTVTTSVIVSPATALTIGATTGMGLSFSGITNAITPFADNTHDLGSNALRFNELFSTNVSSSNVTTTNFFATNGTFTRSTSTNFNATLASFTGLTFTNATGTGQLRIATTTVTGGFFQTDLTDCTSDTAAVSYNATTGKFGCGDDDTSVSTVSTTLANAQTFTDVSPANFADNNTTELFNDATRPNITPQSANNPVLINVSYMLRGASATDNDFVIRVVRENDPGSTTPTCDLTSDAQVGASSVGGTLISAFTTNLTDHQTANGTIIDFPATTTAVYYTICTSASSTVSAAPTSSVLHVGLTEIQGAGSGPAREYTQFYTASTTWTKPVTSTGFVGVRAWCVGGGGGGGGAGTADRVGGGGGGGGAAFEYIPAASLTSTAAVTVGVAGTAGAAGNNDGVAGGTSSFGTFITCTGGGGGNDGNSGSTGGAGGVGSGGDFNANGRAGTDPGLYTDSYRGYGGCAGCNYGDPTSIQDSLSNPMSGSGLLGMYAGGAAAKVPSWSAASYTGGTGSYFGSGGGGGQKAGGGADAAGGAGRQGVVVIVELYN